ncbi:glycosyltransferase [Algibacter amylolyticus]|uniref:Glycosyltransferase n=1 Tax=Algibacter amylolyticus TaxID=1608400 RepID=A0A5M7AZ14_9FLAO|nr:glycosyltransferase [Algibacter amylolyticus]KAA5822442.1 glycosyltransferase [Algibacter amylolyticus]MBB5269165.1 glycosyltransferase involved in cell wall biosynthesis [Algibacter amylolyticus]TSJ73592.1 glycosyltransferase [Algibacter amylolyticus]
MKILLVSMPSLHFFRWTEQLENSGHDVYWFDIVDGNPTNRLPWVNKINGWRLKYPNLKGRYFIKNKLPFLYNAISPYIECNAATEFEKTVLKIKPDLVHSFVLHISCLPILEVMKKHSKIKWVYSSWGSDLYNKKGKPNYEANLKAVLSTVNYLFTDCERDYSIALKYGFKGTYLGSYPGGGGYDFSKSDQYITKTISKRNTIIIKGYQGKLGRCISVLKAIMELEKELKTYKIVFFSTDTEVIQFANQNKLESIFDITFHKKEVFLPQIEILKLMGESLVYIGNSSSDGMPNTLLEAIIMGAFPIQSNPGGATEEVIVHSENGFIIDNHRDEDEIKGHILNAISNPELIERAFIINQKKVKPHFEIEKIKREVLSIYKNFN